jgi:hypothetical protein
MGNAVRCLGDFVGDVFPIARMLLILDEVFGFGAYATSLRFRASSTEVWVEIAA